MSLFNLPIVGDSLLLPTILTSLIVGFMFLILSERKRAKGGSSSRPPTKGTTVEESETREAVEDVGADGEAGGEEGQGEGEGAKGESSSCSSGSEEDLGEKKKPKKKKKHSCQGAKACSSKKTVSEVLVWTDEEELSQVFARGTGVRSFGALFVVLFRFYQNYYLKLAYHRFLVSFILSFSL